MPVDLLHSNIFYAAFVFARVCLAAVFVFSGFEKALNFKGVIAECEAFKLPFPTAVAMGTVGLHIIGGLCLVFGIAAAPIALALAVFTAIATCLAHNFWAYKGQRFTRELTTALEHVGIIGALVLICVISAGV